VRAVVHDRYGPPNVLRLEEVEASKPDEDEVLLKIHATTVNRTGEYWAVIDRRYPLEDVVEATKYVETEQKTGNVVLTVSGDRGT
jgi:NADPH:quinone reductase-like Zn-dependent oxidoreductase